MRYSTYNAIPQYPKSKKHPYESLENKGLIAVYFLYPFIRFHRAEIDEQAKDYVLSDGKGMCR